MHTQTQTHTLETKKKTYINMHVFPIVIIMIIIITWYCHRNNIIAKHYIPSEQQF